MKSLVGHWFTSIVVFHCFQLQTRMEVLVSVETLVDNVSGLIKHSVVRAEKKVMYTFSQFKNFCLVTWSL